MLNVTFVLKQAETKPGQYVQIVGNIPELGQWDVSKKIKLHTNETFYPMWTSEEITINLNHGLKKLEYKFVKILNKEVQWERCGNREIDLS